MNVFKNAVIKKILIILMVVILINSFIMPNYVWAKESAPKKLVSSFFYLLSYVGDSAISIMQKIMLGDGDIEEGGQYFIKYSPGMIFANEVAGLRINFTSASSSDGTTTYLGIDADNKDEFLNILERLGNANVQKNTEMSIQQLATSGSNLQMSYIGQYTNPSTNKTNYFLLTSPKRQSLFLGKHSFVGFSADGGYDDDGKHKNFTQTINSDTKYIYMWILHDKLYALESSDDIRHVSAQDLVDKRTYYNNVNDLSNEIDKLSGNITDLGGFNAEGFFERQEVIQCANGTLYSYDLSAISGETVSKSSIAYELQSNIATWYTALRMIALIGLLSVLLYLGIRIILSSASAQDKAKYKNMIKDWFVAICLLFTLHYIMTFMLDFTDNLNDIIKANLIKQSASGSDYDDLISTVRNNYSDLANAGDLPMETAGYTVMYLALVILTATFTIQYLKRVVFMAFLTMVAPLIALTYPLDKVKDGKAQAFSYWLKEYIFNCLIQPVHLLLYTIFITNAINFAKNNVLYAIVTLAFMVPAEKIIKEMFGMKSNSPSGTLGAAAGGALMMSMLNKIKSKQPKDSGDDGKAPSGVRTASRSPVVPSYAGGNPPGGNPPGGNPPGGNPPGGNPPGGNPPGGNPPGGNPPGGNPPGGKSPGGNNSTQGGYNILRGVGAITGVNQLISSPGKTFKSIGKGAMELAGKATLSGLAGTAMLANEVADGHLFDDPEKAVQNVAGAGIAGYMAGKSLVDNAIGKTGQMVDTFEKGAMGIEEYNNKKYDRQFFNSDNYKIIAQDSKIQQEWGRRNIKEVAQTFLDNGISDQSVIRSAMQNGVNGDEYKSISSMGVTDVKHYRNVRDKNKHKGLNASQIAARMQIAKNLPERLFNDESGFIRYAKRFGIDDENDARRLFKEIDDFT